MNTEIMKIEKKNVIKAYNIARETGADSTMKMLEAMFGEDVFKPKGITERVKTFEDACRELGNEHPFVMEWNLGDNLSPDLEAYLKLRIICAALNEGWEPQFTEDEWRWYPWFYLYAKEELDEMSDEEKQERRMIDVSGRNAGYYAGLAYASSIHAPSSAGANVGSRLCLKNSELATYCGKQFIEIWIDFVC